MKKHTKRSLFIGTALTASVIAGGIIVWISGHTAERPVSVADTTEMSSLYTELTDTITEASTIRSEIPMTEDPVEPVEADNNAPKESVNPASEDHPSGKAINSFIKSSIGAKASVADQSKTESSNTSSQDVPASSKASKPAGEEPSATVKTDLTDTESEKRTSIPPKQEITRNEPKHEKPANDTPKVSDTAQTGTQTESQTETPTTKQTENPPEIADCSHTWVWATKTETIHHDAVTDTYEQVVEPAWTEYFYVEKYHAGGKYYDTYEDFINSGWNGSYSIRKVVDHTVEHPAKYETVTEIIEPAYDESFEVNDYQYCSKCGAKK
ncbi:MAG: hypothetical protein IKN79_10785 [Eubacterium sp.]|nr:hypothetical protein [Eubacterium sp.]